MTDRKNTNTIIRSAAGMAFAIVVVFVAALQAIRRARLRTSNTTTWNTTTTILHTIHARTSTTRTTI
jgi:hypothetical protein